MKQLLTLFFVIGLTLWAGVAIAEDATTIPTASVYNISDVAVDVTADSAAKARDQAIAEAQRTAFTQLLDRLGVETSVGAKLSDNDLATLVQNFEVHNERTSAVRYIGNFAVQFRPTAVRSFLGKRNATFNDTQGKPDVIIPIVKDGDKTILWEEPTRWQKAWSDATHDSGIIPIIVPSGSDEDKALLTTPDAVAGKASAIKALIDKYQADGAVVAVLNGSLDNPAAGFVIDLQHFGGGYDDGSDIEHITLTGTPDKNAVDDLLTQGIKQTRRKIEKEWKQGPKQDTASPSTPTPIPTWSDEEPPSRLAVTVQIATLAEWADIQRRLAVTPGVRRIDITSLGRGAAQIELGFAGTPQDIQAALAQHNLRLTQDILSGSWMLKGS